MGTVLVYVHKTVHMENKVHIIYTYTNINTLQKKKKITGQLFIVLCYVYNFRCSNCRCNQYTVKGQQLHKQLQLPNNSLQIGNYI